MSRLLVAIMVAAASAFSEFGSGGQSDCPREFEIPAGTIVGPNDHPQACCVCGNPPSGPCKSCEYTPTTLDCCEDVCGTLSS